MFPIRILQLSIKSTRTSCLVLSDPVSSVLGFLSLREIFPEEKKKKVEHLSGAQLLGEGYYCLFLML